MDDIYQVIGFLLQAKDLATPAVNAAQIALSVAAPKMEKMFNTMVSGISTAVDAVAGSVTAVAKSFDHVVRDFVTAPLVLVREAVDEFTGGISRKLDDVSAIVLKFPKKIVAGFKATADFLTKERSFVDFYKLIGRESLKATQLVGKGLSGGYEMLKRRIGDAAVQLGAFLRGGNELDKLGGKVKNLGGAFSFSAGPFGILLKLLSPFLNMLEKALTPALETFSEIMENAFAPLSIVAETIARDLAPLVAKFLQPFVNLLTIGLAKVGTFAVKLLDTGRAGSSLAGIFARVQPVMNTILNTFSKLFDAVAPLIEPLLKLGEVLLEKVFAPLLIKTVEGLVALVGKLIPYINEGVPVVVELIGMMSDALTDFFDNFSSYMEQFDTLFIQPIIDGFNDAFESVATFPDRISDALSDVYETSKTWLGKIGDFLIGAWKSITTTLGFDDLAKSAGGAFDSLLAAMQTPIEAMKGFVNQWLVGPLNSLLTADIPVLGKLGEILSKLPGIKIKTPLPKLAKGGILTEATPVIAGEAGPEAILPLKKETFEQMLPGLDEAVEILRAIHRVLTGTLTVRSTEGAQGGARSSPAAPASDLGAAVGLTGLARV